MNLPGRTAATDPSRWRERFVGELRAQGLPADQVSRAILAVERRCAASGLSEPEEFGDPIRHARSVFDPGRRSTGWAWLGGAFGAALGLGLTVLVRGAMSWADGDQALLGLGEVLGVVLLGGGLLGLGPMLTTATRPGPRHALRLVAAASALVVVLALPALLSRLVTGALIELPGPLAAACGLLLTAAAAYGLTREMGITYDAETHRDREAVRQAGMVPVPRWTVLVTIGVPVLMLVYTVVR